MDDGSPGRLADAEVEERLTHLDGLLGGIEEMPGTGGEMARAAVSALAEVYGEALARAVTVASSAPGAVRRLASDQLVGHLMALHGLHPDPPERRVEEAISQIQSRLHGGGSVELAGIEGGVARVEVATTGCGSQDLPSSVRDIVLAAAPDLAGVEAARAAQPAPAFIPVEALRRKAPG